MLLSASEKTHRCMNEIFSKPTIVHSSDATNFASLHFDGNIRALRDFRY